MKKILVWIPIISVLFSAHSFATDWPQWRGPFHNGSTDEKNLPGKWNLKENVVWTSPLPGPSTATPIISKGRVFVSSTEKKGQSLFALCFDAKTGNKLWQKKIVQSERKVPRNNLASPSPAADGNMVYFLYGSGHMAALDYDGNIVWSRNLETEYGNISSQFGYSSSPLLYKDKLYILVQRRDTAYRDPKSQSPLDSFLFAIDSRTGKNIWKYQRKTDAQGESLDSYSSPIVFDNNGRAEILTIGADYVISNDPETGEEIWRYEYSPIKIKRGRHIPTLVTGQGLIFAVKSRGKQLFAINSPGKGTLSDDYILWTFDEPTPDVSTPLYYQGNLYILDGKKTKIITCLDAKTGKKKWQGKLGGTSPYYASITAGDQKLYCINQAGQVVVIAADSKQFQIISRVELNQESFHSSIAIADAHLFIRTNKNLLCIGN